MLIILSGPGPQPICSLPFSAVLHAREAEPSGFLLCPDKGNRQQGVGDGSPMSLVCLRLPQSAAPAGQPLLCLPRVPAFVGYAQHICTPDPSALGR